MNIKKIVRILKCHNYLNMLDEQIRMACFDLLFSKWKHSGYMVELGLLNFRRCHWQIASHATDPRSLIDCTSNLATIIQIREWFPLNLPLELLQWFYLHSCHSQSSFNLGEVYINFHYWRLEEWAIFYSADLSQNRAQHFRSNLDTYFFK